MDLKYGDKIEVYRNLHKKCFSVRHKGRVVMHLKDTEQLALTNTKFVVQPAGRAKVLREKRKNVHAFVRGEFEGFKSSLEENVYFKPFNNLDFSIVSYNPYKSNRFHVDAEDPISESQQVLIREGQLWINWHPKLGA